MLNSTVAYWRFENGVANAAAAGTGTIVDSSGNAHNGTPVNGPHYSATVPLATIPQTGAADKRSMSFDGVNQRVSIPDSPAFQLTQSLTLEAYFNLQGIGPKLNWSHYIVFRGDNRTGLDPYWLGVQKTSAGQLLLQFEICPASNAKVTISAPISMNKWYEAAGTLDNATGKMNLYLNGQLAATTTTTARPIGALTGANPGVGIGNTQSASTAQYFDGLIDEVRISNVALTPNQLLSSPPHQPPTIASLAAAPNPAVVGAHVTLTASGITGSVAAVHFYRESNGKAGLQTGAGGDLVVGTDTSATGGWSTSAATNGLSAGVYTYYAQVIDKSNAISKVVSTNVTLRAAPIATGNSVYWSGTYNQTSASAPTVPVGYFFSDRVFLKNAGDYVGGSLTDPDAGSPLALTLANSTLLQYETSYLKNRAALDAAFPFGTYTTTVTNPSTGASQVLTMSHAQDAFSASIPALTASTFNGMQKMKSNAAFTFNFNSFIKGSLATQSFVFFTITNAATNQAVFSPTFLPSSTTSVTVAANTLASNTKYRIDLNFSNRIVGASGPTRTDQGFDLTTEATFTTGA
jgi:hypothetical protein